MSGPWATAKVRVGHGFVLLYLWHYLPIREKYRLRKSQSTEKWYLVLIWIKNAKICLSKKYSKKKKEHIAFSLKYKENALGQWLFYTPFQCTLPRTFTYQACPFSIHCLSFNALPAEIRTRNHGIATVLMFLRINLITNWGKFCTCSKKIYTLKNLTSKKQKEIFAFILHEKCKKWAMKHFTDQKGWEAMA